MSSKSILVLVAFACSLLVAPLASADSPEETLAAAVKQMRAAGDLTPLVVHIDWQWRFSQLSDHEKKIRGISSATDLRSHYTAIAKANGAGVLDTLKEEAKRANGAQKTAALTQIGTIESELLRQQKAFRDALSETAYKVGKIDRESETVVSINLEKSKGVAIQSEELRMRNVAGVWLFESAAPLNPLPFTFGGTPLGKLPEAIAVLGQP